MNSQRIKAVFSFKLKKDSAYWNLCSFSFILNKTLGLLSNYIFPKSVFNNDFKEEDNLILFDLEKMFKL